mmetsp:Transcript_1024/g.1349  ORF Transcript_1024/g.1349 Transcript_1024/m.1349 type:complete len:321 (-) Transcript_1024:1034-1996(-)
MRSYSSTIFQLTAYENKSSFLVGMLSTSFFSASFLSTTVDDVVVVDCGFDPEANAADIACAWANTFACTLSGIAVAVLAANCMRFFLLFMFFLKTPPSPSPSNSSSSSSSSICCNCCCRCRCNTVSTTLAAAPVVVVVLVGGSWSSPKSSGTNSLFGLLSSSSSSPTLRFSTFTVAVVVVAVLKDNSFSGPGAAGGGTKTGGAGGAAGANSAVSSLMSASSDSICSTSNLRRRLVSKSSTSVLGLSVRFRVLDSSCPLDVADVTLVLSSPLELAGARGFFSLCNFASFSCLILFLIFWRRCSSNSTSRIFCRILNFSISL